MSAVIVGAQITGGHEGQPELILKIKYDNGVVSDVAMENELGVRLLSYCGAQSLADLQGEPWHKVVDMLSAGVEP